MVKGRTRFMRSASRKAFGPRVGQLYNGYSRDSFRASGRNTFREGSLSSDARCNTPHRFGIGRIETSGSVAMRGYSHLSDDEREQIGLLKVLGHSIGAIAL